MAAAALTLDAISIAFPLEAAPEPPSAPPAEPEPAVPTDADKTVAVLPFRNAGPPEDAYLAEELDLDVSGARDVLFQEDSRVAKGGAGLAPGLLDGVVEAIGTGGDAHAAAPPAHRRLDDHRVAQRTSQRAGLRIRGHWLFAAGQHGYVGFLSDSPRLQFIAKLFEDLRTRADENDTGPLAGSAPRAASSGR